MEAIPQEYLDLFEKRAFANLATLLPDGSPHVTPMWVSFDGTHVLINTARGRQKDKNMHANPHVALCIVDPDNPYRYLQVRGRVVAEEEAGADGHIDALSEKYTGRTPYASRSPGEVRVTYKIAPEHVNASG